MTEARLNSPAGEVTAERDEIVSSLFERIPGIEDNGRVQEIVSDVETGYIAVHRSYGDEYLMDVFLGGHRDYELRVFRGLRGKHGVRRVITRTPRG